MNENFIEKTYKNSEKHYHKFTPISDYIGKHYIGDPKDHVLTKEERATISMFSATDMYIGSEFTKKKFIATGVILGVVGTLVTIAIIRKIKSKEEA